MKILNYDVKDEQSDYKQKVPFMPDRCLRMLVFQVRAKLFFFWI